MIVRPLTLVSAIVLILLIGEAGPVWAIAASIWWRLIVMMRRWVALFGDCDDKHLGSVAVDVEDSYFVCMVVMSSPAFALVSMISLHRC